MWFVAQLEILTTKKDGRANIFVAFSCLSDLQGEDRDGK
jgi:hypothetical protein